MRHVFLVLAWIAFAGGCGKPQDNGQTGSPGYACHEQECDAHWQTWLTDLNATRGVVAPHFVSATCDDIDKTPYADGSRPQECKCTTDAGDVIGLRSARQIGTPTGWSCDCGLGGRGGLCLLAASEVPPCEHGDPNACTAACDEAERRLTEDAKRTFDAQVRFSQCIAPRGQDWTDCRVIVEINDQCYTNSSTGGVDPLTAYDCALSDEQILHRVFAAEIDDDDDSDAGNSDADTTRVGGASPTSTLPTVEICGPS